ncbi:hypothetical protein HY404_01290 [Candidatus Microgenomates bacterium]|nr:hypothetical protein [Candidatus Microgenomates bacterium]
MKINSFTKTILVIGVVLRLVLMPITFHPDLLGHSFTAYFFAYEGRSNIYEHLANLPSDHPLVKNFGIGDIFIYPPLTYFTLGIFRWLVVPITDSNFIPMLWQGVDKMYDFNGLYWHLFIFKFPYLFFDIALAFLLAGLFTQERNKKIAFTLWMFNPITLYTSFMIGQLDILPTFFVVLALYLIKKGKGNLSLLALGIGAAYKTFPLLLVLPVAFSLGTTLADKLKKIAIGVLPFVLFALPFIGSPAFREMVLFAPKSQKMLFMNWPVSGAEGILPFILILFVIYFYSYYQQNKELIPAYFLAILLLIFSVTHYHPQWFIWVTPLLIYIMVKSKFKVIELVVVLSLCWLFITLMFESSLSYGLFSPVWPDLAKAPSLSEFLGKYTDIFLLKSIARSIFAAASLYLVIKLLRKNSYDS